VGRPDGPTIPIDGGGEAGPGPVDTMLGALAACGAADVEAYLTKRRTPVDRLEVIVDAERRTQAPRRVVRVRLDFHIDGATVEPDHALRAVRLAVESYCSVAASLAPDIAIETNVVLNGEPQGEPQRVYAVSPLEAP
jgi:putative redox protein